MTVGERIQFYRKQQNLSQEQLGQMLYVSRQTVSLWEKDQTMPTIDNLLKLKEIFGVSADELLSGEMESEEDTTQPESAPRESFTVSYQQGDIRKVTWGMYKKRFIWMAVITGLLLIYLSNALSQHDLMLTEWICLLLMIDAIWIALDYMKVKRLIRTGEQKTANSAFRYEVYEDYFDLSVSRNGERISTAKIQFSELQGVRQFDNLIVFLYNNQCFILHMTDLSRDSRFLWLRSKIAGKGKPDRKGRMTALSVVLIVLSVASIFFGVIIAASMSKFDPASFAENLWVMLCFLPLPIGSIVFGALTQRKGYAYRANVVVGIIMTTLLLIYGLLVR